MRACLDVQAAIDQRSGVGRYARSLAEHLASCRESDELTLFSSGSPGGSDIAIPGATRRVLSWVSPRVLRKAWSVLRVPPFDWLAPGADLYHFPDFVRPPLRRGTSVVTIHDLAFLRFPDTLEPRNLRFLAARVGDAVSASDAVIANSAAIADEVQDAFAAARGKTHAIWPGVEPRFRAVTPSDIADVRRKLGLDRPYLLFVGTLEPRKNLPFAVDVFERMRRFDGELVLAGARGWKLEPVLARINASSRSANIRQLAFVDEAHLPALYAGAELFLFPSLYEGFGFTPLEAMAAGAPVVASSGGSLREVLGDGAIVLDRFDADEWAHNCMGLLEDDGLRRSLVSRGRQRSLAFDWTDTARRTWALYRSVCGAGTPLPERAAAPAR